MNAALLLAMAATVLLVWILVGAHRTALQQEQIQQRAEAFDVQAYENVVKRWATRGQTAPLASVLASLPPVQLSVPSDMASDGLKAWCAWAGPKRGRTLMPASQPMNDYSALLNGKDATLFFTALVTDGNESAAMAFTVEQATRSTSSEARLVFVSAVPAM